MERIVIVGGVAAGATAAAKVRRLSADAEIVLLEAGPDISFANCGLPYYIGGDIQSRAKLILQSPESFRDQYQVEVRTHTLVNRIDRKMHRVYAVDTRSGEETVFEYTKLILAQGGRPIRPEIPGAKQDHVFTLWTLEDMDNIYRYLEEKKPERAVVVGGGFIGLEMAEALAKRQLEVHVVEAMPHVMNVLEPEMAGAIEEELTAHGVFIHSGTNVNGITNGRVKLSNGKSLDADMVLLSIGVRPTLKLATEAGLDTGAAGGLLVNEYLQTSDPDIFAAGDMVEIEHRVSGKKVRIPLAGPANRQGRIAAENVLGGSHSYRGALGTSVVRVFDMVAGSTGLSLKQARREGLNADAVVVHKEHHTSYYPGAENVSVMLIYDKDTGVILGGQTAGYKGADKRLDVIATAAASNLTVDALADIDFAYSPPIGTANDALNMAAYAAQNKRSDFSPSVLTSELDAFVETHRPIIVDARDIFAFEKGHVEDAENIPPELVHDAMDTLSKNRTILVYDETGKKGHQLLRRLKGAGFDHVFNLSGGYISLKRYAQTIGFKNLVTEVPPLESKTLEKPAEKQEKKARFHKDDENTPLVVDVRTVEEFEAGAYPGAVNIPLDELSHRYRELGTNLKRDITVYCASGARSAYAQNLLQQMGYQQVKNGGGLSAMMSQSKHREDNQFGEEASPLLIDVRTEQEYLSGAFEGAVNIPLDALKSHIGQLGDHGREITVYCASGARSAYAKQLLEQHGFKKVTNGGGIMQMMMNQ